MAVCYYPLLYFCKWIVLCIFKITWGILIKLYTKINYCGEINFIGPEKALFIQTKIICNIEYGIETVANTQCLQFL